MVNYQNGKIYAIRCLTTNARYVGCTTKRLLCQRLAEHVAAYKYFTRRKQGPFMSSFDVLQHENFIIELIEVFPCTSRNELVHREDLHIKNTECVNIVGTKKSKQYNRHGNLPLHRYGNKVSPLQQQSLEFYREIVTRGYALLEKQTAEKHCQQEYYKAAAELRNIRN